MIAIAIDVAPLEGSRLRRSFLSTRAVGMPSAMADIEPDNAVTEPVSLRPSRRRTLPAGHAAKLHRHISYGILVIAY